jgi:hypothetical protein
MPLKSLWLEGYRTGGKMMRHSFVEPDRRKIAIQFCWPREAIKSHRWSKRKQPS